AAPCVEESHDLKGVFLGDELIRAWNNLPKDIIEGGLGRIARAEARISKRKRRGRVFEDPGMQRWRRQSMQGSRKKKKRRPLHPSEEGPARENIYVVVASH